MPATYFVGFDPGGKNAFGWASLSLIDERVSLVASGTCSTAPNAFDSVSSTLPCPPAAFAVDAPLFWIQSGDRRADEVVRKLVRKAGGSNGTVSHVNSLRGACLVQGVLVTKIAAQAWPAAKISEAHPKALLRVNSDAKAFANQELRDLPEHERDAGLAAFTAIKLLRVEAGWHDLACDEEDPYFPAGKAVAYWFPQVTCQVGA